MNEAAQTKVCPPPVLVHTQGVHAAPIGQSVCHFEWSSVIGIYHQSSLRSPQVSPNQPGLKSEGLELELGFTSQEMVKSGFEVILPS